MLNEEFSVSLAAMLGGTVIAAILTSLATILIFEERFFEGAWTYFLFLPVLYAVFSHYRKTLGVPLALDAHLGRFLAGQYLLPYQRQERSEEDTRLERIVVPLDGSSFAEHALGVAETISAAFKAEVTLVSVVAGQSAAATDARWRGGLEATEIAAYLMHEAQRFERIGVEADFTVRRGTMAAEVDHLADDLQADLIVMATHGRAGVERLLHGGGALNIVRLTDTPVLMVRPTDKWKSRTIAFDRILVSLDGSEGAEAALRFARAMARKFSSEIVLLSVPETDREKASLEGYLEQVATALRSHGHRCRTLLTGSTPSRAIVDTAVSERADLIMMATRGRGARPAAGDVGSVTDRVVQYATVPVFVVPIRSALVPPRAEFVESA
jgi:nucleotide-binding universal stress UspA family protein